MEDDRERSAMRPQPEASAAACAVDRDEGGKLLPFTVNVKRSSWGGTETVNGLSSRTKPRLIAPCILVTLPSLLDISPAIPYNARGGGIKMTTQKLGNRLKVARAERGVSQEELAALVAVTRQTISAIETRQYCPSALLAFLLAKQLGKRVDELFFLEGDNP